MTRVSPVAHLLPRAPNVESTAAKGGARAIGPLFTVLAALWVGGAAHAAPPEDASMAGYRRASACVAVMKQDATRLVERYRAGATAVRPEVVRLTELGFAFIGTAYKSGLRNPQADQLLAEAEQAQKGQPPATLKQLSTECQAEGARLLRDSNVLERALVSNRARSRVDKLLAPRKPT